MDLRLERPEAIKPLEEKSGSFFFLRVKFYWGQIIVFYNIILWVLSYSDLKMRSKGFRIYG